MWFHAWIYNIFKIETHFEIRNQPLQEIPYNNNRQQPTSIQNPKNLTTSWQHIVQSRSLYKQEKTHTQLTNSEMGCSHNLMSGLRLHHFAISLLILLISSSSHLGIFNVEGKLGGIWFEYTIWCSKQNINSLSICMLQVEF